jgi:hypothetical protein
MVNILNEGLRDRPVFICGHPKSGTTLLLSILDSHPQLVVYPDETFFFRGFVPVLHKLDLEEKVSLAGRYLLHYFEETQQRPLDLDGVPEEYRVHVGYAQMCLWLAEYLDNTGFRHDGDLLSAAILAFAQRFGALTADSRYWVEKTPYNELFAPQIFEWWPQAKCIQVVREPRDIYASYHRKHPALQPEKFTRRWKASLQAGVENRERYGYDRYLILRYEDLVQEPDDVISKITAFLHIEDDPILRVPTRHGVPWEGNSMFSERFKGISAKPKGRWKKELPPLHMAVIEVMTGKLMREFNYPPEGGHRLAAAFHILRDRMREAFKNLSARKLPVEVYDG